MRDETRIQPIVLNVAPKRASRRPVRLVRYGGLALILLILAMSLTTMYRMYRQAFNDAERELKTLDSLLAEQTTQSFMSAALLQENIADDLYGEGLSNPRDLQRIAGGRDMHDRLRQRIGGMPQVSGVVLLDSQGQVVNVSRNWPIPSVNLSTRDYFQRLKQNETPNSVIGQPQRRSGTNSWIILMAERLNGEDHNFAGVVVVGLHTSYFEEVYKALNLPVGGSVALYRDDGLALAHYPLGDGVDQPATPDWGALDLNAGESRMEYITEPGDIPRIVAATHLQDQPVIVSVARSERSIRKDALADIAGVALASLMCVIGTVIVSRLLTRQFEMYETAAQMAASREEADRNLREAEAMLLRGQKLEAVGRLTAGVAHDFNNLLTVVRANAEMLNQAAENPKMARRINAICQAADRGSVLTRQMLAFSRQQILTPASLDLRQALSAISELLRASVGSQNRLETLFEDGLWSAYADSAQLDQAILNLVFNARDAIEKDGVITIECRNLVLKEQDAVLSPGDYVVIDVVDNGSGMTEGVVSQAFDPFFTTKQQGKGTGLGLSQVIGFARQSNGDVHLDSVPGRGTSVKIILPRALA